VEELIPVVAIISIFVILPAMFFKFLTDARRAKTLTADDERTLDELYELAQKLEGRVNSIERIIAAERADTGRSSSVSSIR
jgi:phage shock protein B